MYLDLIALAFGAVFIILGVFFILLISRTIRESDYQQELHREEERYAVRRRRAMEHRRRIAWSAIENAYGRFRERSMELEKTLVEESQPQRPAIITRGQIDAAFEKFMRGGR